MKNKKRIIVHIGLGKTSTTSLQKFIFPKISSLKGFAYNDRETIECLQEYKRKKDNKNFKNLKSALRRKTKHFISYESLVNWNPALWKSSALDNKKIFGSKATIILTLRNPKDYLRSVYQQMVQEGNAIAPEDFFCLSAGKRRKKLSNNSPLFQIKKFNLEELVKLYKKHFKNVKVVPMEKISSLDFLDNIFYLKKSEKKTLRQNFKNTPAQNRSFSLFGMKIAMSVLQIKKIVRKHKTNFENKVLQNVIYNKNKQKCRKLNIIHPRLNFRWVIQNIIDRIVPYVPYSLPQEIFFQNKTIFKSEKFYRSLLHEKSCRK